jgi:TatD DNase family protein
LVDTHAHLSLLEERGIDPHKTLRELFANGLEGLVDVSLKPGDLAARIGAFSSYPRVRFASGLWPHAASIAARHRLVSALEAEILAAPPGLVCALGEFGLDHHWNEDGERAGPGEERELMEMQLELAGKLGLPVIIHSRDAPEETAEILAAFPGTPGVIHCYSYGPEEAGRFLDMGYFISFAGNLSYKNAGTIRDACVMVPPDRILLETDCPYLAPVPFRGKPAHPGMTAETCRMAAEIRGVSAAALEKQTAANAAALFGGF